MDYCYSESLWEGFPHGKPSSTTSESALGSGELCILVRLEISLDRYPPEQICPGLNANEIQIPYDKHHKVSSLVKRHQNTHNSVKYEVLIEQYLHSILDISAPKDRRRIKQALTELHPGRTLESNQGCKEVSEVSWPHTRSKITKLHPPTTADTHSPEPACEAFSRTPHDAASLGLSDPIPGSPSERMWDSTAEYLAWDHHPLSLGMTCPLDPGMCNATTNNHGHTAKHILSGEWTSETSQISLVEL